MTIIPVVIALSGCPLLAAFIDKRSVAAALHVAVPAQLFEVFGRRLRAAHGGTQRRPQVAEALAGMPVCLALEACQGHPREILRLQWFVAHVGEHDCGQPILAVVERAIHQPADIREHAGELGRHQGAAIEIQPDAVDGGDVRQALCGITAFVQIKKGARYQGVFLLGGDHLVEQLAQLIADVIPINMGGLLNGEGLN